MLTHNWEAGQYEYNELRWRRKSVLLECSCSNKFWNHTDGKVQNQLGTWIEYKFQSQFSCI